MPNGKSLTYYGGRMRKEIRDNGPAGLAKFLISACAQRAFRTNAATWYRSVASPQPRGSEASKSEVIPAKPAPDADRGARIHFETATYSVAQGKAAMEFSFMTIDEAAAFFKQNHGAFPWMFIEQELEAARESGHMFPCLRDKGAVVGYIKFGIDKVFVLDFGKLLSVPPGAAFIYDTFIMPSHRRMGLGAFLVGTTAQFARENGCRSLWCHIPSWNEPSIKAFRQAGFEAVANVRYFRILGKEFFHRSAGAFPFEIEKIPGKPLELRLTEALAQ